MTAHPIRDRRYSVTREHCGYSKARHIARFCDLWLGQSANRAGAMTIMRSHIALEQARRTLAQAEADHLLAIARAASSP